MFMLSSSCWFWAERSTSTRVRSNSPARIARSAMAASRASRGFDRAHRGIVAAHHEFGKGLPPVEPLLAQDLDPLVHDRLIGAGRAKAERRTAPPCFPARPRLASRLVQRLIGGLVAAGHVIHQLRQLRRRCADQRADIARPARSPASTWSCRSRSRTGAARSGRPGARRCSGATKTAKRRCPAGSMRKSPATTALSSSTRLTARLSGTNQSSSLSMIGVLVGRILHPDQGRGDPHARCLAPASLPGNTSKSVGIEGAALRPSVKTV